MPHNCNALADIVSAIALHLRPRTVAVGDFTDNLKFSCEIVELGLDVCESVDAGDNLCGVLSETVQDAAERLLADLVCLCGDFDCALCCCELLVAFEECEALCLLAEEHRCEVSVSETNLAVVSDGTRDAE